MVSPAIVPYCQALWGNQEHSFSVTYNVWERAVYDTLMTNNSKRCDPFLALGFIIGYPMLYSRGFISPLLVTPFKLLLCVYWYVLVLVCIGIVCVLVCIGIGVYWYCVCIGMYCMYVLEASTGIQLSLVYKIIARFYV